MSARPTLKLKLSTAGQTPSSQSSEPASTVTPKLKLKFGSSSTPKSSLPHPSAAEPPPPTAKPKKPPKPKKEKPPRLSTPKKRDFTASNAVEDDGKEAAAASAAPRPPIKKIKLTSTRTPITPFIRMKAKGKPPKRPLGVGYDSESSDREEDPAIEEEFILRMAAGEDCEYLRKAVEEKRWGPRSEGGADVRMKFLTRDGRRALVTIRGRHYAASMVDLPCIIEGMKSWDRRGWYKSADICQMLLVLGRVDKEEQAMTMAVPEREVDKTTWAYAHGLTPPMRWVRRRRFRKRVSHRTIEAVEEEVERLMQADEDCEGESKYEVLDLDRLHREESARQESEDGYNMLGNAGMPEGSEYGELDAYGEAEDGNDYFGEEAADDGDRGLEADLEMAMMMDDAENVMSVTPDTAVAPDAVAETPLESHTGATSSPVATPSRDESGDESSDEDAPDEVDEDVLEAQQDMQRQREEIADLEAAIKSQSAELEKLQNPHLRTKLMKKIQSLRADMDLKKAAIGEGVDD